MRIIVVTHPAPAKQKKKRQVGLVRNGVVYELFLTNLPQNALLPDGLSRTDHRLTLPPIAVSHPHLSTSPSSFSCLFCLIAPPLQVPFSRFPFHPSISLRAGLFPIPVALTGDPENRSGHFAELIAHVVGNEGSCVLLFYAVVRTLKFQKLTIPTASLEQPASEILYTIDILPSF